MRNRRGHPVSVGSGPLFQFRDSFLTMPLSSTHHLIGGNDSARPSAKIVRASLHASFLLRSIGFQRDRLQAVLKAEEDATISWTIPNKLVFHAQPKCCAIREMF
jgi:hypothetical protein